MSPPTALFVYGTLQDGHVMASLLARCPRAPGRVRGRLYDLPAGYPALALDPQADWVHGELVSAVDARAIALVDHYEGVDEGLYRRVEVEVRVGLRTERGWVYVMDHPERRGGRLVPSGRWRATRRR